MCLETSGARCYVNKCCFERMMDLKYGEFTIAELKTKLRKRKARLSGRKNELIEMYVAVLCNVAY